MFQKLVDAPLGLLSCIRKYRTKPRGRSVPRHEPADFFQILCSRCVHVNTNGSVRVNINKSRYDFFLCGVNALTVSMQLLRRLMQPDAPVADLDRFFLKPSVYVDLSIDNKKFFHPLVLPLIPADLPQILSV